MDAGSSSTAPPPQPEDPPRPRPWVQASSPSEETETRPRARLPPLEILEQGSSSFEETEMTPLPRRPLAEILEEGSSSFQETETETTPRPRLPPTRYGELITVLSIDGGGIRGLIPAVVLQKLEEKLKRDPNVNTENIHIADYLDVIAGTSTGGLIAAMLATPDDQGRPKYTPQEIEEFYTRHGPKIFPPKRWWWGVPGMGIVGAVCRRGPKYDGKFLRRKIREVTGETKLDETLTTLVVPTFDVKRLEPIIFSSYKDDTETKPYLSDVCIGTSAAPTYFPAHHFDCSARKQYDLIDGGVAANNPTMAAIARVIGETLHRKEDFHALDYKRYLVISIGTGSAVKAKGQYTAKVCAKWSDLKWVSNGRHKPIIDILSQAQWRSQDFMSGVVHGPPWPPYNYATAQASDMLVDWHVSMLLHNTDKTDQEQNYLRIQAVDPLFEEHMLSMDTATRENMHKLVGIGNDLLEQTVARVDLTTGVYQFEEEDHGGVPVQRARTNDEEIDRFARSLVNERNLRLQNKKKDNNINNKKAVAQYATKESEVSATNRSEKSQSPTTTTHLQSKTYIGGADEGASLQ
ncbi:patatin-like protein 4 [Triticum dicoccoides]|uniref:patatin-like protein 4 n=1 Tax=Triticum dicoccoides TaxID=85692 RepID=UPI0018909882|nr:patatin-like protein 4 [Triticum dicoccoides]